MSDDDTFCLTFHDDRGWWFIPTVPAARTWRGPFQNDRVLLREIESELGECYATLTTVNGPPR